VYIALILDLDVSCHGGILGVRVAEWLSHSAVVQEVLGSNPGGTESVGERWNDCKYLPL